MTIDIDVDDSTELLYDVLESNDDIGDEFIEEQISAALNQTVQSLYNNREEIAEQLDEQGEAIQEAQE